jgi:hypothetical protein
MATPITKKAAKRNVVVKTAKMYHALIPDSTGTMVLTSANTAALPANKHMLVLVKNGYTRCPHCNTSDLICRFGGKVKYFQHEFRADALPCPAGRPKV